jgi:hypothetical protein
MFFEEYINFKIVLYLIHCGAIPVQSFGSHIHPQPHGLGLRVNYLPMTFKVQAWKMKVTSMLDLKLKYIRQPEAICEQALEYALASSENTGVEIL